MWEEFLMQRTVWCNCCNCLLIKKLNIELIYSYTSTWPVPSSTILSCAATSGWACINEASNFSCVTWAKENMMIKQYYKDTVIRSNLYVGLFSFKIWRLLCYMCVCVSFPSSEFTATRTDPSFCVHFSQTLSLVFHSPPLEQLLEESWLCPIIHCLHICSDRVVFRFNEVLRWQFNYNRGNKYDTFHQLSKSS